MVLVSAQSRSVRTSIAPTPPILLARRSVRFWIGAVLWTCAILIAAGVPVLVCIVLAANVASAAAWASPVVYAGCFIAIADSVVGFCFGCLMFPALLAEKRAGYTTAVFGGKYNSLWELDDKTGQVIRRPGDKEILNKEWRRLQAVGGRYTDAELMAAVKGKPGWYPDYRNHGVMTWWDGDQWTDHTA